MMSKLICPFCGRSATAPIVEGTITIREAVRIIKRVKNKVDFVYVEEFRGEIIKAIKDRK